MEGSAKMTGVRDSMKALQAAFPEDAKQRQRILRSAMGAAARKALLPIAKQMSKTGDSSGALSESLAVRAKSKRQMRSRARGIGFTSMAIVPVRGNLKAMAKYISHYYTRKGKTAPAWLLLSGIRHGHLIEFGTKQVNAQPFLWPAAQAGKANYIKLFASTLKKRVESAVKREAKKAARK